MDAKGQGALEYLLLIGGVVLVAAIVIALITGVPGTATNPEDTTYCASLTGQESVNPGACAAGCPPGGSGACALSADDVCYFDPVGAYPATCP